MSNVDKVTQLITTHYAPDQLDTPFINIGHFAQHVAKELAHAELLAPELPKPITPESDPEWAQKYTDEWGQAPEAEWHPAKDFRINIYDGEVNAGFGTSQEEWEGLPPEDLRSIGLTLLAVADYMKK